ncbi:MAG: cysteine desulfurase family protein [Clostridia bacterium]
MNKFIYLDNAATTKVDEKAIEAISTFSREHFFNPSATGAKSIVVKNKIEETRLKIATLINANNKKCIIFTSGATESNNHAIFSSCRRKGDYIFSIGEHPSVYNTAKELEKNGASVKFCKLQTNGEIDYENLKSLVSNETIFISTIIVNNETGAISDLKKIAEIKNENCPKAIWHVDAVQAFGKIVFDVQSLGCDLMTFSSHKIHGPKGLGILYAKNPEKLNKFIFGGAQENNLRAGTENASAIAGLCEVVKTKSEIQKFYEYVSSLKTEFLKIIKEKLGIDENVPNGSPYICSLSIPNVTGETLQRQLDSEQIIIGTGSACSSKKNGNRILEAMGFNKQKVLSSIRVSFSRNNTKEEVIEAANALCEAVTKLKQYGE